MGQDWKRGLFVLFAGGLLLLAGCGQLSGTAPDETRERGGIQGMLDDLKNAEYQGGPFENDLDSARAYLLEQLEEKYEMTFVVVGNEKLENYGPLVGATYSCNVAPADAPEQVAAALVSQTMYQQVRDSYAVYFFKEEAEAPLLEFCKTKDYILDQQVSLEMPETEKTWTAGDSLEEYLAQSGASVRLAIRLEDGLDTGTYAEQIADLLESAGQLDRKLTLQFKANETTLFFVEADFPGGFDPSSYSLEMLQKRVEQRLKTGDPR